MKKNSAFAAVSFRSVLLDNYKKLGINEKELVVLLMFDHLLEQGNDMPTSDLLALKMNYSVEEIDTVLANLYRRDLISFDPKKARFALDPLMERLSVSFAQTLNLEKEKRLDEEREERLAGLYEFIEARWERTLTPLEKATVADWVNANYTDKEIHSAVRDGLMQNKVNVRYVDRRLRSMRAAADIEATGHSAISDNWDKSIDETLDISKEKWEEDED